MPSHQSRWRGEGAGLSTQGGGYGGGYGQQGCGGGRAPWLPAGPGDGSSGGGGGAGSWSRGPFGRDDARDARYVSGANKQTADSLSRDHDSCGRLQLGEQEAELARVQAC